MWSGCFQIQVCQGRCILCDHICLAIIAMGIGKNPELFHAANSMLYADAQFCVPCVAAFPLFGKGMVP